MSGNSDYNPDSVQVSLEAMPRTALQAIYHAVTGKTENLSKTLRKNVIIRYADVEQLYIRMKQQIEHYSLVAEPTVTVVLKQADSKSVQYSSWEKFRLFQVNSTEITSELNLRFEFLTQIPNTPAPQRFVININLDSGLPFAQHKEGSELESPYFSFFYFVSKSFPTVNISIDFVDFLIAKIFAASVEEWFNGIEVIKNSRSFMYLFERLDILDTIIAQFGRVGMAVFLISYVYFIKSRLAVDGNFVYATSIGLLLWSGLAVLSSYTKRITTRRIASSIIPSVILMTEGDIKAYKKIVETKASSHGTIGGVIGASLLAILMNIGASYICISNWAIKVRLLTALMGRITVIASTALMLEYEDVLLRPETL